ncbi:hypothetical protein BD410DRAFT_796805 [Rickenella mellea]|uniref:Uncharacterized protein n=1 Tax=Rickenella mellea TaxID=50990 RepID=A0A4Y7PIT1_9AGAM|nr:hypothetical protein BD410DRAFT_796805 [Rickenella mellea]
MGPPNERIEVQDGLSSYFDRTAVTVRSRFRQIEENYIAPSVDVAKQFFYESPVTATAIGIFSSLSFLPVTAFIGFSIFIFASFIFLALAAAITAALTIVSVVAIALLMNLTVAMLATFLLTSMAIGIYLFARLVTLLRSNDTLQAGAVQWGQETKGHISSRIPQLSISGRGNYVLVPQVDGNGAASGGDGSVESNYKVEPKDEAITS